MKQPPNIIRARALRQTQTVAERTMWERLRKNRLNGWGFRRQAPVGVFVVDFLCHTPALILEVDGPVHDRAEQRAFDARRTRALEAEGFLVIRVKEHIVRAAPEYVDAWITRVGEMVLVGSFVSEGERLFDRLPLP